MSREAKHLAWAITILTIILRSVSAGGQEYAEEELTEPARRATERAIERQDRRQGKMELQAMKAVRAEEQAVEIRNPIPLPVEVRNAGGLIAAGKPAGGACPSNDACTLTATTSVREVLVVTALWSATRVECDGVVAASPENGAPIAPWWRCQRHFTIEGPGAGYTGFLVVQ